MALKLPDICNDYLHPEDPASELSKQSTHLVNLRQASAVSHLWREREKKRGETRFKMATFSHNTCFTACLLLQAFTDLKTPLSA